MFLDEFTLGFWCLFYCIGGRLCFQVQPRTEQMYTMITVSHCVNITSPLKLLEADSEHGASGSYLHAQKTWGYSGSVCRTSDHFCTACVHNISVKKDKAHYIRCLTLQRVILKSTKTHYCRSAKENTVPVTLSFLQPAGKAPHAPKAASTSLRGSPRVQ